MKRILSALLSVTASISFIAMSSPAEAATKTLPGVSLNASPEPVTAGRYVTLTGRVGKAANGSKGRLNIYFKADKSSTYKLLGFTTSSGAGNFKTAVKQTTSGNWKVSFTGSKSLKPNWSRVDHVTARAYKTVPVVRWSWSGYGAVKSPVTSVGTSVGLKVTIDSSCSSDHSYQSFRWRGYPNFDFDYFHWDGYGVSGTAYLYPDEPRGYFDLYAGDDCLTSIKVTQGTTKRWVTV